MKPIHSMIRVRDLEKSLAFYRDALGFDRVERLDFDGFTLAYLRGRESDFEIELTCNHGRDAPYDLGDGYGHLALSTADLDARHRALVEGGFAPTPIKEFFRDGASLARFFFVQDPDGYKIEILRRGGRYL